MSISLKGMLTKVQSHQKKNFKDKSSEIQAERTRQRYLEQKLVADNQKLKMRIKENHTMKGVRENQAEQGKNAVLNDVHDQLEEMNKLKQKLGEQKKA